MAELQLEEVNNPAWWKEQLRAAPTITEHCCGVKYNSFVKH